MRPLAAAFLLVASACASAPTQPEVSYPPELAFLADASGFPTDQGHAPGAARAAWQAALSDPSRLFLASNAERIERASRRGQTDRALWGLLRVEREFNPATPPGARYLDRFEEDWRSVQRLFANLPPSTSVAEELFRRNVQRRFVSQSLHLFSGPEIDSTQRGGIVSVMLALDRANNARLAEVLGGSSWVDDAVHGPGAEAEAWTIVEHAGADTAFQLDMLNRIMPFADAGRAPHGFASSWDRWAVRQNRPQRYGTQLRCWCGDYVAAVGVDDPERLDERRAALNLGPWTQDRDEARGRGRCPPNAPVVAQCLSARPE